MYLFECTTDQMPCPDVNQGKVIAPAIEHFAALGITAETLGQAFGIGFAMVLTFALLGYTVGIAKNLINKI